MTSFKVSSRRFGHSPTWNAGLGHALNDHIGLDLRDGDPDEHSLGKTYDSRVVVGVKATFQES
ncbi:MAG TPA: hypothetical protein VK634_01865 [Reyranella sp.]|nr:hypothetical protein [Reyranella sp.]